VPLTSAAGKSVDRAALGAHRRALGVVAGKDSRQSSPARGPRPCLREICGLPDVVGLPKCCAITRMADLDHRASNSDARLVEKGADLFHGRWPRFGL